LILATMNLLTARHQFDERLWWPLEEAEQTCATHCAWTTAHPLPLRSIAREFRRSAAELSLNASL
jgi:hypothetical protein